jgi:hypothetical protein
MAEFGLQTAGALSIVPLLKTMMVPSDGATEVAPDAGVSGVNAFINSIRSTFTYDVKADPTGSIVAPVLYSDIVSFASGMYLSLPQESHESVWHMGFVPAGAWMAVYATNYNAFPATTCRGMDIRYHYFGATQNNTSALGTETQVNGIVLNYTGQLALPRVGANFGITFATDVVKNYSKVRAFAADYKISSTTISGTNFNMNGVFHSGIIADTRFVSQIQMDATSAKEAYPAPALCTQSVTRPDDISNLTVAAGAIDIMGPDYPRQWCSVDMDATDTLVGQWAVAPNGYTTPAAPVVPLQSANTTSTIGAYHVAQLWIAPTDTECWISNRSAATFPTNWMKWYYGAINEDGMLDIDVSAKASIAGTSAAMQKAGAFDYVCNFIHIFAYVAPDGLPRYNLASEVQRQTITTYQSYVQLSLNNAGAVGPAVFTATSQVPVQPGMIFKTRPRMQRNGMATATGGKYIGTLCTLSIVLNSYEVGTDQYAVYAYPGTIRARARNVDAPGRVGPAHCIRYDGLGIGQQMSFSGTTWLQGIALGSLAPFINTNGFNLTVPDNIFSKFAELLWAMSPKYRRIMSLVDYNQYVKPYFRDLTLHELLKSIARLDDSTAAIATSLGKSGGWIPALAGLAVGGLAGYGGQKVGEMLGGLAPERYRETGRRIGGTIGNTLGRIGGLALTGHLADAYDNRRSQGEILQGVVQRHAPNTNLEEYEMQTIPGPAIYSRSEAMGESAGQYRTVYDGQGGRYLDLSGEASGARRRTRSM